MKLLCFLSLLTLAFNSMSKTFHSHLSIRVHRVHENALIDREVVIVITVHVCRCGGGGAVRKGISHPTSKGRDSK